MGQCCGFVKTNEAGVITHQAQFSREIEEHLDKLEKERIEVQETCSQIGNGVNQGSIIGQYDGKDIGHHQSNLSNEIQKQRSVDRNVLKKESAYEDYEVKIVEASPQRDSTLRSYSLAVDKSQFSPVDSHRELERTRTQEKSPSFVSVKKQESLTSHPVIVQDIQFEQQDNNQVNENNNSLLGSFRKSNSKDTKEKEEVILKSSSLKYTDNNEQIFFPGLQSQTNPINNSNNPPLAISPSKKDPQKSFFLQTSLPTNQFPLSNPVSPIKNQSPNQSLTGKEMAEQYQNGGRKSILTNTLTKKDDPNSGSKSLLTHDDQIEKKKEKKVKLIATPDKRFDTDIGPSQDQLDVHTPTKPKSVLKKYDPNASYSDADSPHNKPKKKVKFKESTFKKNSKKKKSNKKNNPFFF